MAMVNSLNALQPRPRGWQRPRGRGLRATFKCALRTETMRNTISQRVAAVPPSGIRRFFDIAATMKDVISLGIGEPDFTTPQNILEAGIASLRSGDPHYTSNSGITELRQGLSA